MTELAVRLRTLHWPWVIALLGVAVAVPLGISSSYISGLIALSCVYALLGLSVNVVYGFLGYTSFGHAAFVGLGAYGTVLLATALGLGFWPAIVLALIPGMALGAIVGFASLRISGVYFAITTLTIAEILRLLAENWVELTNGPAGIVVPRPTIRLLSTLGLSFPQYYLLIVIVFVGLCFLAVRRLLQMPIGQAWHAIRVGADLSESIGIPTLRLRVQNVVISATLGTVAGALLVPKILVITPDLFTPVYSAIGILIVVLGGRGTLLGPLIGGVLFAVLPELLRSAGEMRMAVFGLLLLVSVRLLPNGLAALAPGRKGGPASMLAPAPAAVPEVPPQRRPHLQPGGTILSVSGLTKRYRGLTALKNVSFDLREGEVLGLMGPNGAGKSTCIGLVSGFIAPDAGTVTFLAEPTAGRPPYQLARAGLVRTFQHTAIFAGSTVLQNVLTGTQVRRPSGTLSAFMQSAAWHEDEAQRRSEAWRALSLVGLAASALRQADKLSYGEQRLLSIAIALATSPRVLLLDEPAAGLNPVEAATLSDLLKRLRAKGLSIVLVEHNVRLMMAVCDRMVVLHHGEKITEGTPQEVRRHEQVGAAYFGIGQEV